MERRQWLIGGDLMLPPDATETDVALALTRFAEAWFGAASLPTFGAQEGQFVGETEGADAMSPPAQDGGLQFSVMVGGGDVPHNDHGWDWVTAVQHAALLKRTNEDAADQPVTVLVWREET